MEVKRAGAQGADREPDRKPVQGPDRGLTGTPVVAGTQEGVQEEPQEPAQEKPQEPAQGPDKQEPQELKKSEPKPVDGVMCKNCGAPVVQLSSGAYRCTKEKKFTSIVPIEPLEPSTSEKKPTEPLPVKPEELTSEAPMPPELQFSEYISEKLATELRQVFGITEGQAVYIARTVKDNPQLAQDPNRLAYHIKQLAAKANDYQLQYMLTGIYERMKAEGISGALNIPPIQLSVPVQQSYPPQPYANPGQPLMYPPYPQGNPYQPQPVYVNPQGQPIVVNPQGRGNVIPSAMTKEDMTKAIKEQREEFQRTVNERDRRTKEEREKDALVQTLDGVKKALDNLHTRISDIEKNPNKPSEESNFVKTILEATGKDVGDRIMGVKGELTPEKIRFYVGDEVKKHFPSSPSGTRNQFDMEVEKADHEARARMIEAEESRKGYEAIAGGIRDGLQGLGWNIGAGASGGPLKESSPPPQNRTTKTPTVEQPMEWRDGFWHTKCVYTDCHAPMAFEDGKSTVMCPSCHRVIQVQPTEEELGQKSSAEKSKTLEIKAEAKKEEPKREEPQREEGKPPEPEEKPEGGE